MKKISKSLDSLFYETLLVCNSIYTFYQVRSRKIFPHLDREVEFSNSPIDIVIPAIDKDFMTLPLAIEAAKKFVFHPIRNIFVVGRGIAVEKICAEHSCTFLDEDTVLSITKNDIDYKAKGKDRSGWIFQQFLKLSSDLISDSENILVLDADTVIIRPTIFLNNNEPVFFFSDEFNITYYRSYERLFKKKVNSLHSYVSHMMIFNRNVLVHMRNTIESNSGMEWYKAVINSMEIDHVAAFSEFECYGNYYNMMNFSHSSKRYFHNASLAHDFLAPLTDLVKQFSSNYRSLSFHVYP